MQAVGGAEAPTFQVPTGPPPPPNRKLDGRLPPNGCVALSLLVLVVPVLLGQPLKVGALLLIICEKPS